MFQSIGLLLLAVACTRGRPTEVPIPERYLQPRHFNHHPLQTLLTAASPLGLLLNIPRAAPSPTPSTVGRQGDSSPVQFPTVPEVARPTKSHTPGYITVPKNYAFAYAVKDRQSGDDFSHQQAQNGEATKGEYRVKLPDGRTQIVSYTADSSGYKADVTYEGQAKPQPQEYRGEGAPVQPAYSYQPQSAPYQPEGAPYQPEGVPYQPENVPYQPERVSYKPDPPRYFPTRVLYKTPPTGRLLYKAGPGYQGTPAIYNTDVSGYKYPGAVYKTETTSYQGHYPSIASNSIVQEPDYSDEPEVDYRQQLQLLQKYAHPGVVVTPRPLGALFSPSSTPTGLEYRAVPQTAAEYTGSDTPLYAATPTPSPGYYAPSGTSTAATPITEDQEDVPATKKPAPAAPYPPSSYYSVSTAAPPTNTAVRYFLVPHPTQYVYSDS